MHAAQRVCKLPELSKSACMTPGNVTAPPEFSVSCLLQHYAVQHLLQYYHLRHLQEVWACDSDPLCAAAPKKKGQKVDVLKSAVTDPGVYDTLKETGGAPQTAWRIDRMKNMTYTQFWQLVKERRVDKVPEQSPHPSEKLQAQT